MQSSAAVLFCDQTSPGMGQIQGNLSELLPGVVAPRSGSFSVCICVSRRSELLLGVVAPRSEVILVYAYCVSLSELLPGDPI